MHTCVRSVSKKRKQNIDTFGQSSLHDSPELLLWPPYPKEVGVGGGLSPPLGTRPTLNASQILHIADESNQCRHVEPVTGGIEDYPRTDDGQKFASEHVLELHNQVRREFPPAPPAYQC